MNLYVCYYRDANPERQAEIEFCMSANISNPLFSRVYVFNETDKVFPNTINVRCGRQRFADIFAYANSVSTPDTLHILINTDIVLGEGFDTLVVGEKQAICLSRMERTKEGDYREVGEGSHDCWVWKGRMSEDIGNFYMGKFFCDGILAHQLFEKGYVLKNPAHSLRIYHIHDTNIRNYGMGDAIQGRRKAVCFSENDNVFRVEDTKIDHYSW